jgi:hypothetical protein
MTKKILRLLNRNKKKTVKDTVNDVEDLIEKVESAAKKTTVESALPTLDIDDLRKQIYVLNENVIKLYANLDGTRNMAMNALRNISKIHSLRQDDNKFLGYLMICIEGISEVLIAHNITTLDELVMIKGKVRDRLEKEAEEEKKMLEEDKAKAEFIGPIVPDTIPAHVETKVDEVSQ